MADCIRKSGRKRQENDYKKMNYGTDTETSGSDNDYDTSGKNSGARKRQIMQSPNAGLIQHIEHVDHIHDDEYYRDNDGTQDQQDSGK
jgi:hypothetical protein